MDGKDTITIITAIGVIITAIVSSINIYISFQNNKKTAYINTITSERIRWMTRLKEMLSEFCSLRYKEFSELDLKDYTDQIVKLQSKIKLYLNPNDRYDMSIIEQLDLCSKGMINSNDCKREDLNKLIDLSQKMFKNEWERIKRESKNGDIDMNRYGFWPIGFHQWFRVIYSIIGIILGILFCFNKIDFNLLGGIATVAGFLGYLIDGLLLNIEERKKMIKKE